MINRQPSGLVDVDRLLLKGYRAPGERRYLPEFEGKRATFDLLSVGRDNHHAGSPARIGGNP